MNSIKLKDGLRLLNLKHSELQRKPPQDPASEMRFVEKGDMVFIFESLPVDFAHENQDGVYLDDLDVLCKITVNVGDPVLPTKEERP